MYKLHEELLTEPHELVAHYLGKDASITIEVGKEVTKITVEWPKNGDTWRFFDDIPSKDFGSYGEQMNFAHLCIMAALALNIGH